MAGTMEWEWVLRRGGGDGRLGMTIRWLGLGSRWHPRVVGGGGREDIFDGSVFGTILLISSLEEGMGVLLCGRTWFGREQHATKEQGWVG